jgi:hypothetical protein
VTWLGWAPVAGTYSDKQKRWGKVKCVGHGNGDADKGCGEVLLTAGHHGHPAQRCAPGRTSSADPVLQQLASPLPASAISEETMSAVARALRELMSRQRAPAIMELLGGYRHRLLAAHGVRLLLKGLLVGKVPGQARSATATGTAR